MDDSPINAPDEEVCPSVEDMFAATAASNRFTDRDAAEVLDADDASVPVRDAENIDDLLDTEKFPLENFLTELEQKLRVGESTLRIRSWAKRVHGVRSDSYKRYEAIIRGMWVIEGTTMFVANQRRAELRQLYMQIYQQSLEVDDLRVAVKAVDSMAKLDGLIDADVVIVDAKSDGLVGTKDELTNRTRLRVQELLGTMQERAARHAAHATRAITQSAESQRGSAELDAPSARVMGMVK